jgi:integrase
VIRVVAGSNPVSRPILFFVYIDIYFQKLDINISNLAAVAKLVDAPDLGSGAARRGGSSPSSRTKPWNSGLCRRFFNFLYDLLQKVLQKMSCQNYLMCRNGTYYFRISIPSELVAKLYRREITYSLKTQSLRDAKMKLSAMLSQAFTLFEDIKAMVQVTKEQADTLIQHYLREQIENLNFNPHNTLSFMNYGAKTQKMRDFVGEYRLERSDFDFLSGHDRETLDANDIKRMTKRYRHGLDDNLPKVYETYQSDNDVDYSDNPIIEQFFMMALNGAMKHLDAFGKPKPVMPSPITGASINAVLGQSQLPFTNTTNETIIENAGIKLSSAFDEYMEEGKRSNSPRTIQQKQDTLTLLCAIIGDVGVNSVDKTHGRQFKAVLMKMPSNAKKLYPKVMPIEFLDKTIPSAQLLSDTTINDYLDRMKAFFNWLIKNDYYNGTTNPFADLNLAKNKSAKEDRDSFTSDQLQKIFTSPVYKGCRDGKQTGRYVTGDMIIKDDLYWLPLIGLYSGARLGEICQLQCDDIVQKDGVWCFDINNKGEKSLKNLHSIRMIPIHSTILNKGFIAYVNERKAAGRNNVFNLGSAQYSKRFGNLLKRVNAKTDKTSFHSYRHTMRDALVENEVAENIAKAILGHEDGSVHSRYGVKSIPVTQLSKVIEKIVHSAAESK